MNSVIIKAVVDTGAQVSCIAHSVFQQLKLTEDTDKPKQTLTHARGGPLHTHGTSTVIPTIESPPFTHSIHIIETPSRKVKVKVGVLRPVQQPGSYWDRSSELPLVGLEPTEVAAYD